MKKILMQLFMFSQKPFWIIILLTFPLVVNAQTMSRSSKQRITASKNSNTTKIELDKQYDGEIGDYLPCVIKFQSGQRSINSTNMGDLSDVAKFLHNHPSTNIVIAGSSQPSIDGWEIAKERAVAVKKALITRYKIPSSRLIANRMIASTAPNIYGDLGFLKHFTGSSDVVVFYEQGFKTLNECMQMFSSELDELLLPVSAALAGAMIGYECPACQGTGMVDGHECSECRGFNGGATGIDAGRSYKDGMKIAQGLMAKGKSKNASINKTNNTKGWQIKKYNNGIYEGHLINGKRNGWGRFVWMNGECYTGQWKDDKIAIRGMLRETPMRQGKKGIECNRHAGTIGNDGKMSDTRAILLGNGTQYVGEVRYSKFNGYGELQGTSERILKAVFTNGKPGKGRLEGALGILIADFSSSDTGYDGLPAYTGNAEFRLKDGGSIKGAMRGGFPNGKGELTTKDGDKVYGSFMNMPISLDTSKPCLVKYKNGDIFVGYGGIRPEGIGTWYYAATHKYVGGEWKNGKIENILEEGTYIDDDLKKKNSHKKFSNGEYYSGEMLYGLPHGVGAYTYTNGDVFEGYFEYGERSNRGTLTFANGEKYIGEFRYKTIDGKGEYFWPNGDCYSGKFSLGKRTGKGILRHKNHKYEYGLWHKDKMIDLYDEGKWKEKNGKIEYKSKSEKKSFLKTLSDFLK